MAQLYFYYSTMNAGKSTSLLQSAYNYKERGMNALLFTAAIDDRYTIGTITSRIGLQAPAQLFTESSNLFTEVANLHNQEAIDCVLLDEAQFLTREQVQQLCHVVDQLNIPVLCYGLRTDFQGELFEGSRYLLAWAEKLSELKTVCHCGSKATMVVRTGADGQVITEGSQVEIGGNERYVSLCRLHFHQAQQTKSIS
ncbi:thymidine kinase [Spartinivicinus poritis]|uniref:Thymidine kinase n=1 Tax=Spartinivicinus poritis TaxID=2994640 RepID=A0ABT5UDV4_9GAMM|nr:thymidine kinase [Spartinivicinus sp. A2-2]MDE1464560.1 thymidine kinase [Spartinivicinus sp. A2-2]